MGVVMGGDGGVLGLDIGGANLKAAHSSGPVRSRAFAVWKGPARLPEALRETMGGLPPFHRALVTMTAELCDCFRTKREGVLAVLDAVASAIDGRPLSVWGVDGAFHDPDDVRRSPAVAAAANWRATSESLARRFDPAPGLLLDVGSTTTDLVPFAGGRVVSVGSTDTERLRAGELVYAGVRRTPLCAVAEALPFGGVATPLMAELFATTLDVHLILGETPEDPDDLDTADGRPATREYARDRLARMVGADRESFGEEDARALASSAVVAVERRLLDASGRVLSNLGAAPAVIAVAGSGEFLARRLAERLAATGTRIVSLAEEWGAEASSAACAVALTKLWGAGDGRV